MKPDILPSAGHLTQPKLSMAAAKPPPTPLTAGLEESDQAVRLILRGRRVRRVVKDLCRLDICNGGQACRSAPPGARRRPRTLKRQGAVFPSKYAPDTLVPEGIQEVEGHMLAAAALKHPMATEDAAMPADAKQAVRTVWAERMGGAIQRRRSGALRVIRRAQAQLAFARELIEPHVSESIKEMPRRVDVPLLYALGQAASCPDAEALAVGFAVGFDAVGDIPPSGWWDTQVKLAEFDIDELDHEEWIRKLEDTIRRQAADPNKVADAAAVRERTQAEVEQQLMRGPFTKEQLDEAYGAGQWRPMHGFGVWQKGKVRRCDNALASKHNKATSTFEALSVDRPDFAARVADLFYAEAQQEEAPLPPLYGATDDLPDAYRDVPTKTPNYTVVAIGAGGAAIEYYTMAGFNFGLVAAVLGFNRLPEATTAIARRLLAVVCTHYFDDFAIVEPASTITSAQAALGELHQIIGLPFAPKKQQVGAPRFVFLGVETDLSDAPRGQVRMRVTQTRIDSLVQQCREVMEENRFPPSVAASLSGKLLFTLTWAFGRLGRACLQPLLHHDDSTTLTTSAAASLRYLIAMLPELRPMELRLGRSEEPPVLVYTDGCAEESPPQMAVGFVVGTPPDGVRRPSLDQYEWVHGGGDIPEELKRAFIERKQQIGQVEIVGAITPYLSVPHLLAGKRVIHWIDNTSALAALCKGYSNQPDSARLVHAFHAWQAGAQADVWFEYVPSKPNPADEPSRVESLWTAAYSPCALVSSAPCECIFPRLSSMSEPAAWAREARDVRRRLG
jgi:hypothetical protein